jgi:sporulation-control protein spo0M
MFTVKESITARTQEKSSVVGQRTSQYIIGPAHHHNQLHFEMNIPEETAVLVSSVNETIAPDIDASSVCESTSSTVKRNNVPSMKARYVIQILR